MKKVVVFFMCVSLSTLWFQACGDDDDDGESFDAEQLNGMWEVESTEESNNCPDFGEDEEEDDGPMYLLIEVSEDGDEITIYDCTDETGDNCATAGDTYDFDGNSFDISDSDTEDMEFPYMDCFFQMVMSGQVTFTSQTECSGSNTINMSIVGDDADDCADLLEAYFGESFDGCTVVESFSGVKL